MIRSVPSRPQVSRTSGVLGALLCLTACVGVTRGPTAGGRTSRRLPTGQMLDPAGTVHEIGQMPLAMSVAPDGQHVVLLLSGWRETGVQVVDETGTVTQTLPQWAAFLGLAFTPDGRWLFASGGNADVIYRYAWENGKATLADSIVLAPRAPGKNGTHYPAGLAVSPDGRTLYVAENLADSLAVVELATGRVVQRLATGRYPYGVALGADGAVFVSSWDGDALSVFDPAGGGRLAPASPIVVGRYPSALLTNATRTRLFVTCASTDHIAVVDTRTRRVIADFGDPPPSGPNEGTTPNALALSADGTRLFAAEGDANAVAVFALSAATADVPAARGEDRLAGRIPVAWYPTALAVHRDTLYMASGKGMGTGPNPQGPQPGISRVKAGPVDLGRQYTLGQLTGALTIVPVPNDEELRALSERVMVANGWNDPPGHRAVAGAPGAGAYPPFTHVIYIIKENRTYDQVLGDVPQADGDTSLVLFGRDVTPNHHALAERFGVFDRFFVNAEVSADGHAWSIAAYVTDYGQKTIPINYSAHGGRSYDYDGENRDSIPMNDVAAPAAGFLWDQALRSRVSFRNFGEQAMKFPARSGGSLRGDSVWRATRPTLVAYTDSIYPGWDLAIPDQRRADRWLQELRRYEREGAMPALQIVYLPNDHTAGGSAGAPTPRAMVADNDLALGRVIEALSKSPFWTNTVVFVLEDDAQNGPDHVDSHRSPVLVISPYNRPGVSHRFANTTDVVRTIEEILGLRPLSQFDYFGRPLREIWAAAPDPRPYVALTPAVSLDERNPARTRAARESARLDLREEDAADMERFNRILWRSVKGDAVPYPGTHRMAAIELRRSH